MASSNQRRRQVARAKFERQQLRRSMRAQRRRRWRRVAIVIAIVALVGLIAIGAYWIFFSDAPTTAAASVSVSGRTSASISDPGGTW